MAVSTSGGNVEVIDRRRIVITAAGTPGANQPYHFAENLGLPEAETHLRDCFATAERLASAALRESVDELRRRDCDVIGSAVLQASGRPLPPLAQILASHALIHAAEGEFFREAIRKACEGLGLAVTAVPERKLDECVRTAFGAAAAGMCQQIASGGRSLGPPWTRDQKTAALAALVVLADTTLRE